MVPRNGLILIVEDNDDIREAIRDLLVSEGYDVEEARDGGVAIERLRAEGLPPCTVLLDLMMPRVSGYEVLRFLEQTGRLEATPLVVMTAVPSPQLPARVPLLRKPIRLEQLFEALHSCESRQQASL